jgi:acetylornithine/N-succinyldiaminopimelate aminotransferase
MSLFNVYPLNPIAITKAAGSRVWDDKGQEYLDMYGGHAVISIGHTHPHWVKRIEDQLHAMAFYSNSVIMPIQEQLATAINDVSGKKDFQLFLCNSGAEANENALKLASFHTGRKKIIAFKKSFHGRTSLAVAATDNPSIVAPVNETDNIIFLPLNDITALQNCFATQRKEIAAVIIEGIQGVAGIYEASIPFLQAIRKCCDEAGVVYIADSVQCGYGRTGQFFSHDIAGVNADIYSMAKGMGNGFPIGAILIAPHIQAKFGLLGTTFGGNPLACASALAVIEVIQKENLMALAAEKGSYLIDALKNIAGVKTVRGRGLMIGFEMEAGLEDLRKVLLNDCKVFTGEAKPNVIRLLPSLAITMEDIQLFLNRLNAAIQQLKQTHS